MAIDDGGLHSATQSKIQVPEKRYALDGLVPVSELMGKVDTLTRRVEDAEKELIRAVGHCEEACLAERRALDRVEQLEAIVAKLPKTADGVPIVPGMFLYELKDGKAVAMESMPCCGFDIAANGRVHLFFQVRKDMERDLIGIYSTEAAALAAKESANV